MSSSDEPLFLFPLDAFFAGTAGAAAFGLLAYWFVLIPGTANPISTFSGAIGFFAISLALSSSCCLSISSLFASFISFALAPEDTYTFCIAGSWPISVGLFCGCTGGTGCCITAGFIFICGCAGAPAGVC